MLWKKLLRGLSGCGVLVQRKLHQADEPAGGGTGLGKGWGREHVKVSGAG